MPDLQHHIHQLPRERQALLVILGGCFLAFLSSGVNIGFLIHFGISVSHLTGDISKVGMDLVIGDNTVYTGVTAFASALAGFLTGAILAGYYICHPTLEFTRPYGRTLVIISGLLVSAHYLMGYSVHLSFFIASAACGLQNAMATHYRGVILRTTHVTGLFTDLGNNLGMKLRGHAIDGWKIAVPASLSLSFFAGSATGAILVHVYTLPFLLAFATLYLLGGISYVLFKKQIVALMKRGR